MESANKTETEPWLWSTCDNAVETESVELVTIAASTEPAEPGLISTSSTVLELTRLTTENTWPACHFQWWHQLAWVGGVA